MASCVITLRMAILEGSGPRIPPCLDFPLGIVVSFPSCPATKAVPAAAGRVLTLALPRSARRAPSTRPHTSTHAYTSMSVVARLPDAAPTWAERRPTFMASGSAKQT